MVAAKPAVKPADENLQLCKAFAACEAANVLVMGSLACCRVCSRQILSRVEHCPACRGTFTGYAFYHMQGAYKAVHNGKLTLFFGYFTEEGEGCHSRQRFCYPQATDEQLLDVGNRIVKSVRGAGASVEWSGDPGETIVIKDLTSCERDYISRKLGPDNIKWAKAARKMADKMGPVSGGEVLHDCDCMEYSCFCGTVRHLGDPHDDAHTCSERSQENDSDSDWTTCSEDEFKELQPEGCACDARQCTCGPDISVSSTTRDMSAVSL